MAVVLAGEERPVRGHPAVGPDQGVPSRTANGNPAFFVIPHCAFRSFGARATSSATVSVTYRHAVVAVPTPNPPRDLERERLSLAQVDQHQQGLLPPRVQLPPQRPDCRPVAAHGISPAVKVRVWRDNGSAAR